MQNKVTDNIEKVLPEIDVVYMVRLQDEYDGIDGYDFIDINRYSINNSNINNLKNDTIILHPLPRRNEISVDVDNNHRAKYWQQCKNGMWMRVGLICNMFGVNDINLLSNKIY